MQLTDFEKGEAWAEECFHAGMTLKDIEYVIENGETFDRTDFDKGARSMIRELKDK